MAPVTARGIAVTMLVVLISAAPAGARPLSEPGDSLVALYNELGVISALNDEMETARTYFDSALALAGDDPSVLNNLGNYYLCTGRVDSAIARYETAEALDTSDQSKLFNWAVALYMSGATDSSVAMMQRFLESTTDPSRMSQISAVLAEDFTVDKASSGSVGQSEFRRLIEKAREKQRRSLQRNRDSASVKADTAGNQADSTNKSSSPKRVLPAAAKQDEYKNLSTILFWVF